MSGAMNKVIPVAGLLDMSTHCLIYFPSRDLTSRGHSFLHRLHSGIARLGDDLEYLTHPIRRRLAHESRPGDVVVNGVGRILFGPHIQQDKIALTDRRGSFRLRLVVWVAAIGIHRDDAPGVRHQIFAGEGFPEPMLNFTFGCAAVADPPPDLLESLGGD